MNTGICLFPLRYKELRVGFELEDEIADVNSKQEYSGAMGNEVKTILSILILVRNQEMRQRHHIPVVRETGVLHAMVRSGDHEGWAMVQECLVLRPQMDVLMHARAMS